MYQEVPWLRGNEERRAPHGRLSAYPFEHNSSNAIFFTSLTHLLSQFDRVLPLH